MVIATHLFDQLSPEQCQQVESWLVRFEKNWTVDCLAAHVGDLPAAGPLRLAVLIELIKIDLERQRQAGRPVWVEDYLQAYPELGAGEHAPTELLVAECQVRRQF